MAQNVHKGLLIALAASAVSSNGIDQDNPFWTGLQVGINITAITGAGASLTVVVEGRDEASGVYFTLLSSAALTATGFTLLTVYPGIAVAANVSASQVLPKTWRVRCVIAGTTPAVTATIGASLKV
jgi:hypothetical protein